MSFVSLEDGLGTISYKAKGFRIVHEPTKGQMYILILSKTSQRLLMSVGMVG